VGLIGFPSVGKSTLLTTLTALLSSTLTLLSGKADR
jgi:ribosome-interacting GTPase 1